LFAWTISQLQTCMM